MPCHTALSFCSHPCRPTLTPLQAKLADFGLVREMEGTCIRSTRVVGTPGYVDPAYMATNLATTSVDVYW